MHRKLGVMHGRQHLTRGSFGVAGRKRKRSMAVRSLLMYRKNFATLLAESVCPLHSHREDAGEHLLSGFPERQQLHDKPAREPTYLTAAAPPSQRPRLPLCSVCGYKGKYTCLRCGLRYCDIGCQQTHDESRCERR